MAIAGLFAVAALAGCMGGSQSENKAGANKSPVAKLDASKKNGFTGETYHFDARQSSDPDGEIRSFKFDFGDNTSMEVDGKAGKEREIDHVYKDGGKYVVTVTVTDNGGEDSGALTSTDDVAIAVNLRQQMTPQVTFAGPASAPQTARASQEFPVKKNADRVEADVKIVSGTIAGSSEFECEIKDASGKSIDKQTKTVDAGQNITIALQGATTGNGNYVLNCTPKTGGGTVGQQPGSEIRVYYDKNLT